MEKDAKAFEIRFSDMTANSPARLDLAVPAGTPRAKLLGALEKILAKSEIEKFRPRGCQSCLSGLDINIRERFEHVLRYEI